MTAETGNGHSYKGTALIYCRISDKNQLKGMSLETQEEGCRAKAEELGYSVGTVYREVFTGHEWWDRPQLQRMRREMQAGSYQALIIFVLDRLAREQVAQSVMLLECDRAGVELISVLDPIDKTPEGKLLLSVKGYVAEVEREKIRERTLRGKRGRIQSGKIHNYGTELYGYRRDKEVGVRMIYEPEAAVIRQMFRWVGEEGISIREVCRRLNAQRTPPPVIGKYVYTKFELSGTWSPSTVGRKLREPAYKGEAVVWRTEHKPDDEASENGSVPATITLPKATSPAIVSTELWETVNGYTTTVKDPDTEEEKEVWVPGRLETSRGDHTRNQSRPNLLRGLIFCATCGRRMCICPGRTNPRTGRKTAAYYRCSSHLGAKGKCGAKQAPADAVEAWAWERVSATLRDPSTIAAELERRRAEGEDPILVSDLETAKRSLAKIERQQERLLRSFAAAEDDSFPMELVQKEVSRMEQEKAQVRATVAELERRIAQQDSALDQLEALSAYCERVARNIDTFGFEEKRLALEALGVRVVANGRDWQLHGTIPLTPPDAVLSHVSRRLD